MEKISIITVSFNSENTIEETILSVINQNYLNYEYIIIDGKSSDSTLSIITKYKQHIKYIISEKDNGMYDAINKGIKLASGNIIGLLNSDDVFSNNNILSQIALNFNNHKNDILIADVKFINNENRVIRNYSSSKWNNTKFQYGFMPAHPSFYCRKHLFDIYGYYRTDFKIAADFELLLRFFINKNLKILYLPLNLVDMKMGGLSTSGIKSTILINKEIYKACSLNKIHTNYFKIYSKYFIKLFQYKLL